MEKNIFEGLERPHVMVAMPAFNEEKSVGRVVSYAKKYAHLVIVVNDCSTDNTAIQRIRVMVDQHLPHSKQLRNTSRMS